MASAERFRSARIACCNTAPSDFNTAAKAAKSSTLGRCCAMVTADFEPRAKVNADSCLRPPATTSRIISPAAPSARLQARPPGTECIHDAVNHGPDAWGQATGRRSLCTHTRSLHDAQIRVDPRARALLAATTQHRAKNTHAQISNARNDKTPTCKRMRRARSSLHTATCKRSTPLGQPRQMPATTT